MIKFVEKGSGIFLINLILWEIYAIGGVNSNGSDYDWWQGNNIGFDHYRCEVCGKEYRRYWEGNFWTIHDYYFR